MSSQSPSSRASLAVDVAAINAGVRCLAEAFGRGDADAVLAVFADQCVTLPPNEPARVGQLAVREWHEAIFEQFSGVANMTPDETEISGDLAYVRGAYSMSLQASDGQQATDQGKFIMIWRRQPDHSWRIARNIWNSDNPLTGT